MAHYYKTRASPVRVKGVGGSGSLTGMIQVSAGEETYLRFTAFGKGLHP